MASRPERDRNAVGLIVWGRPNAVSAGVFARTVALPFEGASYPAPAGWDEWLTSNYGDYLQLPPEDQQVSMHRWTAYHSRRR